MRTKAEHKKHLTKLFGQEAERHGLTHVRQLAYRLSYGVDCAIALDILLQTHARSPHVWAVPYAGAWRKDLMLLQKKLGVRPDGRVNISNLGYFMSDRESWHEWVFLNEEPEPGTELVDRPDYDRAITYGCERDVINHLFDGFFEGAVPRLRRYTKLEGVVEMLEAKPGGSHELRPMVYFLLGDFESADRTLAGWLAQHHHETLHGAYCRRFAEALYAEMGMEPPPLTTEPRPTPGPVKVIEKCFCVFKDQFAAQRALPAFLEKGHDCIVEHNYHGWCCVVTRVLSEYKIDGWQRRRVRMIAEKHGGELLLQQLGG